MNGGWFSLPPERVRYAETDALGVAHHAVYLVWFERGRVELLRSLNLDYRTLEERHFFFPVIKASCRYRRSLRFDDLFVIQAKITGGSRFKMIFSYRVLLGDEPAAEGTTVHGCLGEGGRPREIPWREWFGFDAPGIS